MFLRRYERKKDGKRHVYWALVESIRTARGSRQKIVAYLGEVRKRERSGWAALAAFNRDSHLFLVMNHCLFCRLAGCFPRPRRLGLAVALVGRVHCSGFGSLGAGWSWARMAKRDRGAGNRVRGS